jgi:hypothetical protein
MFETGTIEGAVSVVYDSGALASSSASVGGTSAAGSVVSVVSVLSGSPA